MSVPLCIKPSEWPASDRLRYRDAREGASFMSAPDPASKWSAARRRNVEQGYGQWLSFLARHDWLDADAPAEQKVSPERVGLFVLQLQERVSSWSVYMIFEGFARIIMVLAPDRDWDWLRRIRCNLKCIARSERDKRSHMVDARQLLALGVETVALAHPLARHLAA